MKGTQKGWVLPKGSSQTENLRETHLVMPSELQALPKLEGYLHSRRWPAPGESEDRAEELFETSRAFYPEGVSC